jgi:glutathione S-transferase
MTVDDRIALSGAPGSPYTRKMLALLRYRRLPYRFLPAEGPALASLPAPKVRLLPTFYMRSKDGGLEAVVDSTPIIRRLEAEYSGRSVVPTDPALAFLDALIEDYADEWLTKAMFHYRWVYQADIRQAGRQLPLWRNLSQSDQALARTSKTVTERQIGRLHVVGSNAVTGPVIEASYRRFLEAFEAHLMTQPYGLGARPGAGDFGVYGQLTQLTHFDPTPMALTLDVAPRVFAWVDLMEDRSGVEPADSDWIDVSAPAPTLIELLKEIGRVYPPVMLANARALASGATTAEAEVDGSPWTQPPFPYQGKCLQALRDAREALSDEARRKVDGVLAGTGCEALFG